MCHPVFAATMSRACANLRPRQQYARDVIRGHQAWSGADLRGAARRWSANYSRQRDDALRALRSAGGTIIAIERGRLVSAVRIGTDDFGAAIYATAEGAAIQHTARQARSV